MGGCVVERRDRRNVRTFGASWTEGPVDHGVPEQSVQRVHLIRPHNSTQLPNRPSAARERKGHDDTVPDPIRRRIWLAKGAAHGGVLWTSLPTKLNEKLPRIPR